jgi:ring-1,2-phenylacetyl-CoA epoxidase subunit PaaD
VSGLTIASIASSESKAPQTADDVDGNEILSEIWRALETLTDPEIPVVSLREMGILRDVRGDALQGYEVVITPTYSGCPAMEQIHDDVLTAMQQLGHKANVVTQLAPAWTTDWMTAEAREKLRAYGIAPPLACATSSALSQASAPNTQVLTFAKRPVANQKIACPQCASDNTTEISHFGSTTCKALYKCLACLETFDYFKPY